VGRIPWTKLKVTGIVCYLDFLDLLAGYGYLPERSRSGMLFFTDHFSISRPKRTGYAKNHIITWNHIILLILRSHLCYNFKCLMSTLETSCAVGRPLPTQRFALVDELKWSISIKIID